jgi:hypothetical protein
MSVIEDRLPYLEPLKLGRGSHDPPSNGLVNACVMEAVAYVAGEPFSDHPECASPVITSFLVYWNDSMNDVDRQMLKPYIVRVVGTRTGKRHEEQRAWMLTDWLARECAPAWLRLAGLAGQAELLESLAPLTSAASASKAQLVLDAARKDSAAAAASARDAAWDAARDAAWDAAWDAAGAAAWAAARAAAWDAARAAAWDAARAAARDAAWDAAWDAARDAAWDAAWDAARAAARAAAGAAAWAAARAAAAAALAPTTRELQQSALLLLDRMIAVSARGGDAT